MWGNSARRAGSVVFPEENAMMGQRLAGRTTGAAILAIVGLMATPGISLAQESSPGPETKYWPLQKISFPVDVERLSSLNPKPQKLRFFAAAPGGKFDLVSERRVDELEDIVDQNSRTARRGFNYTCRADGTEEFALQYVFANNEVSPLTAKLAPQYRIVFDTRPPSVRLAAVAATSVDWVVEDENLVADSVRLEVRYPEQSKWTPVGVRAFGTRDRYTWSNIPAGKILEVRVTARDKAGHEGVSQVVQLPATNNGTRIPRAGDPPSTDPYALRPAGTGFGNPDDFQARPQIEYVNTNKLTVRSKFTRVTRSGIDAAILWVNDGKSAWKEEQKKTGLGITAVSKDPQVEIPYNAAKDGLYGFIVLPVNGAGGKPDDPREGDPAQWLVEVDTLAPQVEVRTVRVAPGGLTGPRVEIEWTATDKNLMPEPITIEYQEVDAKPQEWKPIAVKIPNTGRYIWEVEDKNLWKFKVRITAVDKASNSSRSEYKDLVLVDLDKPAAVIEKVQGTGGPVQRQFRPEDPNQPMGLVTPKLPTPKADDVVPVQVTPKTSGIPIGIPSEKPPAATKEPEPPAIKPVPVEATPLPGISSSTTPTPLPNLPGTSPTLPAVVNPVPAAPSPIPVAVPTTPPGTPIPSVPTTLPTTPSLPTSPAVQPQELPKVQPTPPGGGLMPVPTLPPSQPKN
jgi:hypothetical protein